MEKLTFNYQDVMTEYCRVNQKDKGMVEFLETLDDIILRLEIYLSGKYQIPAHKISIIKPTYKVIKKCFYPDGTNFEHLEDYFDSHADAIKYAMKWSKRIAEIGRETVLYIILEA